MGAEELLKYGKWSGPGWTAGLSTDIFTGTTAIRITDADRQVPGIDRYDNFVAKAHDLNEYQAQDQLRLELEKLDLISNETTEVAGHLAYKVRLNYGQGGAEAKRFVSLRHYLRALEGRNPTRTRVRKLASAFISYYSHVMYSNLQFSVDCVLNSVSFWRNLPDSIRMLLQLGGAPILFNGEAERLDLQRTGVEAEFDTGHLGSAKLVSYLKKNLVAPNAGFFAPVHGEAHIPALKPEAIVAAHRMELVLASFELQAARDRQGERAVADRLRKAAPKGFASVAALRSALQG